MRHGCLTSRAHVLLLVIGICGCSRFSRVESESGSVLAELAGSWGSDGEGETSDRMRIHIYNEGYVMVVDMQGSREGFAAKVFGNRIEIEDDEMRILFIPLDADSMLVAKLPKAAGDSASGAWGVKMKRKSVAPDVPYPEEWKAK